MTINSTKLLTGKKGIITGVANNLSISWAIAQIAKAHGADIALTYQDFLIRLCNAARRSANHGWRVVHTCGSSSLAIACWCVAMLAIS